MKAKKVEQKVRLRVKRLDMETGGPLIVVINEKTADEEGIHPSDRVLIKKGKKKFVGMVDVTERGVFEDQIGLFEEWDKMGFIDGDIVSVSLIPKPSSIDAIRKKLRGEELSRKEIYDIIGDISRNELTDIEQTAFVAGVYTRGMSLEETYYLTKSIVAYGQRLKFKRKVIVDKHCIGGVAGNRTTPIVVPIVAASGLLIPKTSSRAITSPAGTADTVEVLTNVSFSAEKLVRIVKRTGGCMVWGGSLNLAPADDKIIRIEQPLSLDPEAQLLASVMAKKYSVGATHVVIDIPLGPEAKVKAPGTANHLKGKFIELGEKLGIRTKVLITDGSEPIGDGVGPSLEARDVLKVLYNYRSAPKDLREKSLFIAGTLFELVGKAKSGKGKELAEKILKSGKALRKFQEIISAQGGNPDMKPEDIPVGGETHVLKAGRVGIVSFVSNKGVKKIASTLGAPRDKEAGVFLHAHTGTRVKRGDKLMTLHAKRVIKFQRAVNMLEGLEIFKIE